MNLNINIDTDKNCKVIIQDNSQYLPEDSTSIAKGKFKHSDITSIVILQHNKIEESVLKEPTYYSDIYNMTVPINFDGYFTIYYIVLPNKKWFDREYNKEHGSAFPLYSNIYFEDNGNIYKLVQNQIVPAYLKELIEINPVNTTISITNKNYVSICYLQQCYINLCKQIFNNRNITACSKRNIIDNELIYKRDLVWMAINMVKYLTDLNQLNEAERIIEQVTSCNGICTNEQNQTNRINSGGCGCSK